MMLPEFGLTSVAGVLSGEFVCAEAMVRKTSVIETHDNAAIRAIRKVARRLMAYSFREGSQLKIPLQTPTRGD